MVVNDMTKPSGSEVCTPHGGPPAYIYLPYEDNPIGTKANLVKKLLQYEKGKFGLN